jgi:predicted anti-sigma-YlaC factor YlaD
MDCHTCREALSARLDGENEPCPSTQVDIHLAGCVQCHTWHDAAIALNRSLRVHEVSPTPDMVDAVLSTARLSQRRGILLRTALGVIAAIQVIVALSQLLDGNGVDTGGHSARGHLSLTHLFNESAAWNLALGVGMLWAAAYSRRATGLLPAVSSFVVVLAVLSAHDLAVGATPWSRLLTHLPLAVGLILLYLVDRDERRGGNPLPDHPSARPDTDGGEPRHGGYGQLPREDRSGPRRLRPVSRHRAA